MRPLDPVADDRSIEAALGLCAGLLLKRAGDGFLEVLDAVEWAADDVDDDGDRALPGQPRVLFDRERDAGLGDRNRREEVRVEFGSSTVESIGYDLPVTVDVNPHNVDVPDCRVGVRCPF